MRANLVDWSRHQGKTDVELLEDLIDGVIARCTIGWSYKDAWYIHNFMHTKAIPGKLFGAYHVLWPENRDPKREARWFKSQASVDGVWPDFIVCDDELMQGLPAHDVLRQCEVLAKECGNLFGVVPRIYTGSWFWNGANHLGPATPGGWEHQFPLIEAEYLSVPLIYNGRPRWPRTWRFGEEPQPPIAPKVLGRGWQEWWMMQWTSKLEPIGVQSKSQDGCVYNGTLNELIIELGIKEPPLMYEQKTDILWEAHPELHLEG